MGENIKTILLATGQKVIDEKITKLKEFEVVAISEKREDIKEQVNALVPDVVLIGEGLRGSVHLPSIILDLSAKHPYARFIYLAGDVPVDDEILMDSIKKLARAGIYDLVHVGQMKRSELIHLLYNPRQKEDVTYLLDLEEEVEQEEFADIAAEDELLIDYGEAKPIEESEILQEGLAKVIAVSSVKPGTGKSFIAVNLATAIAQYGVNMPNGKRPRVALIEADLQNLSIGTLLKIDDKDSKLLKAMEQINKILTPSGQLKLERSDLIEDANVKIRKCFTPYHRVRNLEVLAGSHLKFEETENINPNNYSYLISAMKNYFDYIIIDSNSSINHQSTFPILRLSATCFYILNLDFNNVRNNIRYKSTLEGMGIKNLEYVLNEDIREEEESKGERLEFTKNELLDQGFKFQAEIPSINKAIFNNRLFEGVPVVLGDEKETFIARQEILKLANRVHPIMNFSKNDGEELVKKRKLGLKK